MKDRIKIHIKTVLDRLKSKFLQFIETLPATKEQYLNFTKDLGEFYTHEIHKIKLAILSDLEEKILADVEKLSTKEQNSFYEADIRKKLEESSELEYIPVAPKMPTTQPKKVKLTAGAILGGTAGAAASTFIMGGAGAASSIMTGTLGKILITLFSAGAGAIATDKIVTHIENQKIERVLEKFIGEELIALEDFSGRIESLYQHRVNDFFEREDIKL